MAKATINNLYHYCSTEKFESIISGKSVRLSSLTLSNDTLEGKLLSNTLKNLLSKDKISAELHNEIERCLELIPTLFEGLGFCFSEKPDLLSQWRGYADDGYGFSIGFSKDYFERLSKQNKATNTKTNFFLGKVEYEPNLQEKKLNSLYNSISSQIESETLEKPTYGLLSNISAEDMESANKKFLNARLKLFTTLLDNSWDVIYLLKNKAFSEEVEWRLISLASKRSDFNLLFRASRNCISPYKELELESDSIAEVFIGPKNISPPDVIEQLLARHGFNNVQIRISQASYR